MTFFKHMTEFAQHIPEFGPGFIITLQIASFSAAVAGTLGFISGMSCAYCDLLKALGGKCSKLLHGFVRLYPAVFKGIPLAVLLFTLYYILPFAGFHLPAATVGILGIGLYHGAYVSAILRRSIAAVPELIRQNACSLGMKPPQVLWHVLLPSASRVVTPSLLSAFSVIVRNTSVVMIISATGILGIAESFAAHNTDEYLTSYLFAGLVYMMLSLPLAHFAKRAELRVSRDPATDIKPGTSGFIKISEGLMEC